MEEQSPFTLPSLASQWSAPSTLAMQAWANALAHSAGLAWVGLVESAACSEGDPAAVPGDGVSAWEPASAALQALLEPQAGPGSLYRRCLWPPGSHGGCVADGSNPPEVPNPREKSRPLWAVVHAPLAPDGFAAIDAAWAPWIPALLNALGLEGEAAVRARAELNLLRRQDWLEQALCFAREVVWELDVPTMNLRYSRYIAGLQPTDGHDIPISCESFLASMHPQDRDGARLALDDYIQGRAAECYLEYRQRHREGHWIWSRSRGRAVGRDALGRPLRILGTAVGISLQKNMEASLRESQQRLLASEAQLKAQEGELRRALALAQDAVRDRTQFLATMSHEIRTPLNSVVGASRLALLETDPQALADQLNLINDASALLMNLVNSVLDHSRLQAGAVALELRPVNLSRLLHDVVRQFTPTAQTRGLDVRVRISPEVPAWIQADALRLMQVLNNLVSNALRFTHVGGVELRAEVVAASVPRLGSVSGQRIRISVSDSGIGLSAEQCSRLFKAYGQADESIARRYGGTGLGLAISHRLVELMGGQLTVRSQPGVGSVFAFECDWQLSDSASADELDRQPGREPSTTDRQPVADRAARPIAQIAPRLRGLRVLVVDDNPMNILVVRKFLEKAGIMVQSTASAREALERLESNTFDAVLMDLYMPEMSGADATRVLRQDPRHRGLPVLAVSASVTPEERALCQSAGMDAFISKPLDPEHLLETLAQLCPGHPEPLH